MKPKLETIEIYTNPNKEYNSTVIWMHGLGADGFALLRGDPREIGRFIAIAGDSSADNGHLSRRNRGCDGKKACCKQGKTDHGGPPG